MLAKRTYDEEWVGERADGVMGRPSRANSLNSKNMCLPMFKHSNMLIVDTINCLRPFLHAPPTRCTRGGLRVTVCKSIYRAPEAQQ